MTAKFRLLLALALLAGCFAPGSRVVAAPVHPISARAWDAPHVTDELLVKLPPRHHGNVLPGGLVVLREIPALGLAVVKAPGGRNLAQAAADLADQAAVEWAEPNYTLSPDLIPNDPFYSSNQLPYLSRIDAPGAWDLTEGRPETIIAVLDTGVDLQHEDLAAGIWTNPGEIPDNGLDDEGNGFIDDVHGWNFPNNNNQIIDDYGHGTHVAGIAAARIDNGVGIAGMAGRATIMPVDVFQGGIGTYEDLIRAIIYATDNGARVINMSLGASSYSKGEEAAVDYAYNHGVVVVAAAGNSGKEEYHYPAAHAHAIAVASTTSDDFLSSFSTRGEWVDVAAPGSGIYSTYPGSIYWTLSGTSMATPHVSGLAALILSRNPTLTPDQVRAIIESTADDLGPTGRDIYFGAGRINAGRALAATAPSDAPPPVRTPGPGLNVDLPGCTEQITNGGFEEGTAGWQVAGAVEVTTTVTNTGTRSLHFVGGPSASGVALQGVTVPGGATAAVLRFDYRIDPKDYGRGASPAWPFDDWFTLEWRTPDRKTVGQLLRTGNTADSASSGLPWDHYIYRLDENALAALKAAGPLRLVFTLQNDADNYPTDVWIDRVSFCTLGGAVAHTYVYLPLIGR